MPALDNVLMPTSTVAELVNEARRGSAEARDELVRRHHREAAILAAAMVNDPTEAEDISQEAFIRTFRSLDLLVDPSRFAAWLRRIVNGVSIDWLRSFRPDLYRGWTDADEMVNASRDRSPAGSSPPFGNGAARRCRTRGAVAAAIALLQTARCGLP